MVKPKIGEYRLSQFKFVRNPNMPHYEKDPVFVKKAERAKEKLEKYGIPEVLRSFGIETSPEDKNDK